MKTWVILNPAAGGGRAGKRFVDVAGPLAEMASLGEVTIRRTTGPGHATEWVQQGLAEGVEQFISVGGDGTLFEVVNGLDPEARPNVTLGLLPLGTGNSFGRDLDVVDVESAMAALQRGQRRRVDLVRLTCAERDWLSINLVGIGFTALAGSLTNRRFKAMGALGYVAATVIEVARLGYPTFPYVVDGGERFADPCTMVSFCNSGFTGGAMNMAPGADISDGLLDIIEVGALSRRAFLSTFPKIFQGTHTSHDEIHHRKAAVVDLELDGPVDIMVDGEVLHAELRRLQVLPGAVQVFA